MKSSLKYTWLISLVLSSFTCFQTSKAQTVYEHVSNHNIYDFVDELANDGIIEINSAVKPYPRILIAEKLLEAKTKKELLNKRQEKELTFYLLEYKMETGSLPDYNPKFDIFKNNPNMAFAVNPLGGYYKDENFTMAINPIWGINYFIKENENIFHRWGGIKAHAYVDDHWGFYASLRDNNETKRISEYNYFTLRPGGAYKGTPDGGGDFSEMRGGVTYSWNWGTVGLVKDHVNWGTNYHGPMIMSDRAPSSAQIKLHIKPVKWFELNYYHGWLVSMDVDSIRSYYSSNPPREVYRPKYIAANMFTFTPWKKLNVSVGNSIIYSDMNVHPAYLIPVLFFKSVDHTVNNGIDNQNSQMFFDVSSRNIKNLHLYGTLYIDELKVERITDPDKHNFWSAKVGFKTSNMGLENLSLNLEYSMSMPITYQHRVPTLTYESNFYNMGYYLRDNSQEIFASIGYKPIRGLHLKASYLLAQHGPDYVYEIGPGTDVTSHGLLEDVKWQNETISFRVSYEFINNAYLFAELIQSNVTGDVDVYQSGEETVVKDYLEIYTPEFFRGDNTIISAGFNIGF
ncbi:MAG: capsule assembly Wzi family protein [Bacteroidales bacterium]|nr:capsule assembly Wzi family protein [Bacteroidales bacterium]MCF8402565.1 capsule assembly Wzi family protein [Bacteroidales bacterium]